MTQMRNRNLELFSLKKIIYLGPDWTQISEPEEPMTDNGFEYNIDEMPESTAEISLLVNMTDIPYVLEFERRNRPSSFYKKPFYLYYDENIFCYVLDNANLAPILLNHRFVLIVGEDNLNNLFQNLEIIFPRKIYEYDSNIIANKIQALYMNRIHMEEQMVNALNLYYSEYKTEIYHRIINRQATIAVLLYNNEPKAFQEYYEDIKAVWENMGYTVLLMGASLPYHQTNSIYQCLLTKPDLVFQVNKSRDGTKIKGERLNLIKIKDLLVVNWIQDFTQHFFTDAALRKLTDSDFILSIFDSDFWKKYPHKEENMIYGGMQGISLPSVPEDEITQQDHEKYDCDINFCGSLLHEKWRENYILSHTEGLIQKQEDLILLMTLLEELKTHACGGDVYRTDEDILYVLADRYREITKCSDEIHKLILKILYLMRYQEMRWQILKDLGQSKTARVHAYIVLGDDYTDYGNIIFKEFIHDRKEFAKALRCSKMTLQVNPDTMLNRRVGEACLCGSVPIMLRVQKGHDICGGWDVLGEFSSRNYFDSKEELTDNIHYFMERQDALEGQKKIGKGIVTRKLSKETVYTNVMLQIIEKVTGKLQKLPTDQK